MPQVVTMTTADVSVEEERKADHTKISELTECCELHPSVVLLCKTRILNPVCPICVDNDIKLLSQKLNILSDHFEGKIGKEETEGEPKESGFRNDMTKLRTFARYLKRQLTCASYDKGSSPLSQALTNLASFRDGRDASETAQNPPSVGIGDVMSILRVDLVDAKDRMLAYKGNKEAYRIAERALQQTALEMHRLASRLVRHDKHVPFGENFSNVQLQIELSQMAIVNVKCDLRKLSADDVTLKSIKQLHLTYASLEDHLDDYPASGSVEHDGAVVLSSDTSGEPAHGDSRLREGHSSPERTSTKEMEREGADRSLPQPTTPGEAADAPILGKRETIVAEVDCRKPFSDALHVCVDHLYMRADFQTTTVGDIIQACEEAFGIKFNSYTKTLVMQRLKTLYVERPKVGPSLDAKQ